MSAISKSTAAEGQWMSDKTELDLDAERASFNAIYDALEFRDAYDKGGPNVAAFTIWLAARRATIQPTAEAVHQVWCRAAKWEDISADELERWSNVTKTRTLYTAPADAVRDARDLALEEAAAIVDAAHAKHHWSSWHLFRPLSAAMRALKSTAPKEPAK